MKEARHDYGKLKRKTEMAEQALSNVMNWLYTNKYRVYLESGNKNITNINRYVNNAETKFCLSQNEKTNLLGYMPEYLKRFEERYAEETEDLSHVVCVKCGNNEDGKIMQCDRCGGWMCNKCAGKPADEIPDGKKHHNPEYEDCWGCGDTIGITDFVGQGYINVKHEEYWGKTHSSLYAPVYAGKANKIILKEMDDDAIDYFYFEKLKQQYEGKRKKVKGKHDVEKRKKRFIADDSGDEKDAAGEHFLEITNGDPAPQKECVPDPDNPGTMRFRKKWSVETWYRKIKQAARSIEDEPHLVLGLNEWENDTEFVKHWYKDFLFMWHDDKIKDVLTEDQQGMVHEMLPTFKRAKEIFLEQIDNKKTKQSDVDKNEDRKEGKKIDKRYNLDSDSDD
jgi:hypothetical protein